MILHVFPYDRKSLPNPLLLCFVLVEYVREEESWSNLCDRMDQLFVAIRRAFSRYIRHRIGKHLYALLNFPCRT